MAVDELVVNGEGRDGVADEEGVGVANHEVGEVEHDLAGEVFAGECSGGAAVGYELDGGVVGAEAVSDHNCVTHNYIDRWISNWFWY